MNHFIPAAASCLALAATAAAGTIDVSGYRFTPGNAVENGFTGEIEFDLLDPNLDADGDGIYYDPDGRFDLDIGLGGSNPVSFRSAPGVALKLTTYINAALSGSGPEYSPVYSTVFIFSTMPAALGTSEPDPNPEGDTVVLELLVLGRYETLPVIPPADPAENPNGLPFFINDGLTDWPSTIPVDTMGDGVYVPEFQQPQSIFATGAFYDPTPVPEPTTLALAGVAGLALRRRR